MLTKIKAFLYAVTHATGRLFELEANLGPFRLDLWVGREDPDAVRFAVDIQFVYEDPGHPMLDASVEVGVIRVELALTRSHPR